METPRLTFEQVEEIVNSSDSDALGKLRRVKSEQDKYNEFMEKLKNEFASVEDFILARVFGWHKEKGESGKWLCTANQQDSQVSEPTSTDPVCVCVCVAWR